MSNRYRGIPLPTDEEIRSAYAESYCLSDLCRRLGDPKPHPRRIVPILERMGLGFSEKDFPVSRSHPISGMYRKGVETRKKNRKALFERDILPGLLIENCDYDPKYAARYIRGWNLEFGWLDYKCECGNTGEWLGKKLTLQLDHKNGVKKDNRLLNLRFLCPNCHSQTETYMGGNIPSARLKRQLAKNMDLSAGSAPAFPGPEPSVLLLDDERMVVSARLERANPDSESGGLSS